MVREEDIIARSVSIEVVGEISRCKEGTNSRFYCLPVIIHFDNGEKREYMLKAFGEPKTLQDFLENKKGLKDRMEKGFALLRNGEIRYVSYLFQEASS
ncbi:hypothetical protein [Hydrogenobacter hydrogenophilus]|uniref:Uncharacterized protein n=1 Tax=Hydrogenobacter hydrogenophilus TaxID=35835 RepID=A0A285NMX8_9AQUI|nr:hypothetical protein [Hydrogenobacter hydrogenophilus]SNZ10809.1 hypothetical protein SAMN06265353_0058 [Hydrogenobacter hydrogenophilus]